MAVENAPAASDVTVEATPPAKLVAVEKAPAASEVAVENPPAISDVAVEKPPATSDVTESIIEPIFWGMAREVEEYAMTARMGRVETRMLKLGNRIDEERIKENLGLVLRSLDGCYERSRW